MTQSILPPLDSLKAQAKNLRRTLEAEGNFISHSEALELVAHQYGCRDWNTAHAAAGNRAPAPLAVGHQIRGRYLGQAVRGEVIGLSRIGDGHHYRITIDLDEAVDVVSFDSFSSWRKRINATIDARGQSDAKTSDGQPQLSLSL